MSRDDELATTLTASPRAQPEAIETLGRYRIERTLGAGGMGVVYAAFDPDLERRIALKLLAPGTAGVLEQRLLREARAMARLTHPNVVAVYEVGTAGGRDFIAMELVDGESLVDWLRAAKRSEPEIVDAFVQAGRGLVAAHAAGVVHRDFKPHNVLRSHDGRVAVTDFGLAREVTDPLAVTAPVDARGAVATSLSGLTVAGALLGTPAYMAPEQWRAERITPATDQFAYCVALWEALAGKRPYDDVEIDALRDRIFQGPDQLDDAGIPRRLRKVLRRGLHPDPAQRWPSMAALLARIQRAERSPGLAIAIVVGALAIAGALVFAVRDHAPAAVADACPAAALDPMPTLAQMEELGPAWASIAMLRDSATRWHRVRAEACKLPADARAPQLACLDRVAQRIDAARRAHLLAASGGDHLRLLLVEPSACASAEPPKLPPSYSDHAIVALAGLDGAKLPEERVKAAQAAAASDPCVRTYLALPQAPASARNAEDARNAASQCGDDYAYALTTIATLRTRFAMVLSPDIQIRLDEAERAVERAPHPALRYELLRVQADLALANQDTDKAALLLAQTRRFASSDDAAFRHDIKRVTALVNRGKPTDLASVRAEAAAGKIAALGVGLANRALEFDLADATAQWKQGDTAAADVRLRALLETLPPAPLPAESAPATRVVSGRVVDARGIPVARATVVAGVSFGGDSHTVATPMIDPFDVVRRIEIVTTDASGAFTLQRAPEKGIVVAELGASRSRTVSIPAARDGRAVKPLRVVVGPTSRIAGRVVLHGPRTGEVSIGVLFDMKVPYWLSTPVREDGSFELAGVPHGVAKVGVWTGESALRASTSMQTIRVGAAPITDLVLDTATRSLRAIIRSTTNTPLTGALVVIAAGKVRPTTMAEFGKFGDSDQVAFQTATSVLGEPPKELATLFRANDLVALFDAAPKQAGTICAVGFQGDMADDAYRKRVMTALAAHPERFGVHCSEVAATATTAVIEVPPLQRLD